MLSRSVQCLIDIVGTRQLQLAKAGNVCGGRHARHCGIVDDWAGNAYQEFSGPELGMGCGQMPGGWMNVLHVECQSHMSSITTNYYIA